ncbi:mitochondrial carrier domain-containing protein [Chytridium lagenaria]|nr:mitochondrial carrier domain-containing protein [Chytridium lagenaria]
MANRESLTWTTAILKENRTIVAASSAAVCSVLGGFPFDSIKTRMQTHSYKSMSDCIRQTYRAEGLRGFFRGIFPPLITVSIIKSVSFTVYLDSKTFFRRLLHLSNHIPDIIIASTLSGGIAGSVVSVISCPLEIVKIQRQLEALLRRQMECSAVTGERQKGGVRWRMLDLTQRSGSLAVGVDIVKSKGVKGLYRGFHLHLARDAIGTAIYFATYESVKRSLVKEGQTAGPSVHLISGALCGVTSWIFVFPVSLLFRPFTHSHFSFPPTSDRSRQIRDSKRCSGRR